MRSGIGHSVGWENAAPSGGGSWTKGLEWALVCSFRNQQGEQSGWYRVKGREREVAGGKFGELSLGDHRSYKAL